MPDIFAAGDGSAVEGPGFAAPSIDVVRSGLRHIIEAQPNWQVVAEAAEVRKALETKPDLAVIDYSLPLINGVEATHQIRAALPHAEVLIFTMHDNKGPSV